MKLISKYSIINSIRSIKTVSSQVKHQLDPSIEIGDYKKYKKHPGKFLLNYIEIPEELENTINKILSDQNTKFTKEEIKKFKLYLHDRRCLVEKNEIFDIKKQILEKNNKKELPRPSDIPTEESDKFELSVEMNLKSKIHSSLNINYNHRMSLLYMATRFAPNYAVAKQIFTEIKKLDAEFRPEHLFDFGSGVGTVMWAARSIWKKEILEIMNHDTSQYMNSISDLIARGGSLSKPHKYKGISFKRNLNKSDDNYYNLVTCTFSLFDIGNRASRFEILNYLWSKVKQDGYLVLAEIGTKHGFKLMSEARDYILTLLINNNETEALNDGYVVAPCSHQFNCPMLDEGQVCRFFSGYRPLDIYDKTKDVEAKDELSYSYLVFKKSKIDKNKEIWPRFVHKNPFVANGLANFWLCTSKGKLEHHICTKKRCKATVKLAYYSRIGDCLPVTLTENVQKED